jgi:hypothetical protein
METNEKVAQQEATATEVATTEVVATATQEVKKEGAAKSPEIVVLKAVYGIEGVNQTDVTDKIKNKRKITNKLMGGDPVPGKVKTLKIRAKLGEIEKDFTFAEHEKITMELTDFVATVAEGGGDVHESEATEAKVAEEVTA